jgi:hypothetical protein
MPQYTKTALEEQLKTREKMPVGWPWRLLLFMALILGTTIAVYSGMALGYKPYLNSRIKNLDAKIVSLTQSIDEEQQRNLTNFYSGLVNIQSLLASHPAASKFLDFLEKNTHQQVHFLSLNLSLLEKNIKLEGLAVDYNILTQQLELFRQAPETERVFLDDSRSAEEGVRFSIRVVFKPELFK